MADFVVAGIVGIGLSAACGFRVFVPPLLLGLMARGGKIKLMTGFEWLLSDFALILFGIAAACEIAAYYVPWVDNLLDSVATPTATLTGIFVASSILPVSDPALKWSLAITAGGGVAMATQLSTMQLRLLSTAFTGGLTNFVLATLEWVGASLFALLAIFLPYLAAALLVGFLIAVALRIRKTSRKQFSPAP